VGFRFQAWLNNGKRRAHHWVHVSGHTSHDGVAPLEPDAMPLVADAFGAAAELEPPSEAGPRHDENRLGAVASTSSDVAGPEDKLNLCGTPAQPESPDSDTSKATRTSPTSGGRLMAFPPASTSFALPHDRRESESLPIRLRLPIHRQGSHRHPVDSTAGSITTATQFLPSKRTF
jgi:hypothetical protein